jgi:hypothetical protein
MQSNGYTLYCRGPLAHSVVNNTRLSENRTYYIEHVDLTWAFTANPEGAGADGATLKQGTCAWEDRPLSETEPRKLHTGFGQLSPESPPSARLFINLDIMACNNHPQCIFVVFATNARNGIFDTYPDVFDILYLISGPPG